MNAIEAHNLTIGYKVQKGRRYVVHQGLDLELHQGKMTCLIGLNGAGKSTLLKTLCGLIPALCGKISLMGKDLDSYSRSRLSQLLGVVLTDSTNAGGITVYELISLGRHPHTGFFGQLKEKDHEIVRRSMEAVGLCSKAESYVSELSDGERQKAFVAKVLAQECPIIVLDEPTAFLDVTSRMEVMVLLKRLAAEEGKTVLLSTHDLDSALQLADELWMQRSGSPVRCGTVEQLVSDRTLEDFFNRGDIRFDVQSRRIIAVDSQCTGSGEAGKSGNVSNCV